MKTHYVHLKILEQALIFWEDNNLWSKMNYSIFNKFGKITLREGHSIFPPLIGSELNESGELAREIQDYKFLRKYLDEGDIFDIYKFLPRVPKNLREKFNNNSIKYLEALEITSPDQGLLLFPSFIHKWLEGKKVCEIGNPDKIELVDFILENHLSYLPYDCFILSLKKPLILPHNNGKVDPHGSNICTFSQFMIWKDENVLKILSIPDDVEKSVIDQQKRIIVQDIINMPIKSDIKKIRKKLNECINNSNTFSHPFTVFILMRIDMTTGEIIYFYNFEKKEAYLVDFLGTDPSFYDENIIEDASTRWTFNVLPFLLNGIGKLFKNYTSPDYVNLYDFNSQRLSELIKEDEKKDSENSQDYQLAIEEIKQPKWCEISPGNITFITVPRNKKKKEGVKIHTGREMPPHLRRKHIRRIFDKTNSEKVTKLVEVHQTTVRKDKLQNESVHGSISKYY